MRRRNRAFDRQLCGKRRLTNDRRDSMLRITDAAMRVLDEIDRPSGRVVRLIVSNDGRLAPVLGKPLQGDVVVNGTGPGR
jgi:hypothetical protein